MGMSIGELISHVRKEIKTAESHESTPRKPQGCKWCGCFLSLKREDSTIYHAKNTKGGVDIVVAYHGKSFCQACHRFQREEATVGV